MFKALGKLAVLAVALLAALAAYYFLIDQKTDYIEIYNDPTEEYD